MHAVGERERAVVALGQRADDGKAKARATVAPAPRRLQSLEGLGEAFQSFVGRPWPSSSTVSRAAPSCRRAWTRAPPP